MHTWQGMLLAVMYAPLIAWGPLLGAVTWAYYRRRTKKRLSVRVPQTVDC